MDVSFNRRTRCGDCDSQSPHLQGKSPHQMRRLGVSISAAWIGGSAEPNANTMTPAFLFHFDGQSWTVHGPVGPFIVNALWPAGLARRAVGRGSQRPPASCFRERSAPGESQPYCSRPQFGERVVEFAWYFPSLVSSRTTSAPMPPIDTTLVRP